MHLYLFTAFLVLPTNQNTCSCKSHFNYASLYFICYKHFINFISTVSLEWPVKLSCISLDCGGRPEDRPGGNFFLRWWFGENIQTLHRKKKAPARIWTRNCEAMLLSTAMCSITDPVSVSRHTLYVSYVLIPVLFHCYTLWRVPHNSWNISRSLSLWEPGQMWCKYRFFL